MSGSDKLSLSDYKSKLGFICSHMLDTRPKKEIEYIRSNLKKIGIETFKTYSNTIFTKTIFKKEFINKCLKS